ncbi:MAG: hypothetical protein ACK4IS_09370 [Erythrobacter sp.]
MRAFKAGLGFAVCGMLALPQAAHACQPSFPPPPPPPLYGESEEEYRARVLAEQRAREEREQAEAAAARLKWESSLWDSAERVVAVAVLAAPRIQKQHPTHRTMEIVLRPITMARGMALPGRLKLRYDRQFSICGYSGAEYFSKAEEGDVMVLFTKGGKLDGQAILDASSAANAAHPDTLALLERARGAL